MGEVTGPLDANGDDALIGDVGAPSLALLAAAFEPAYITVVPSTEYDNGDVAFDTHVADAFAQDPVVLGQLQTQGELGRGSTSESGAWWVYVQGAYEPRVETDWDPDAAELFSTGTTWQDFTPGQEKLRGRWSFVFAETVRDLAVDFNLDEEFAARLTALHEIGHQFGLEHPAVASDDVMGPVQWSGVPPGQSGASLTFPRPRFSAADIAKIRCSGPGCPPPSSQPSP